MMLQDQIEHTNPEQTREGYARELWQWYKARRAERREQS
jgi:hypothetical protein